MLHHGGVEKYKFAQKNIYLFFISLHIMIYSYIPEESCMHFHCCCVLLIQLILIPVNWYWILKVVQWCLALQGWTVINVNADLTVDNMFNQNHCHNRYLYKVISECIAVVLHCIHVYEPLCWWSSMLFLSCQILLSVRRSPKGLFLVYRIGCECVCVW